MQRNLDKRVEVIAPVNDPQIKSYLKSEVLEVYLRDNVKARLLQPDGSYLRVEGSQQEGRVDSQMHFQNL